MENYYPEYLENLFVNNIDDPKLIKMPLDEKEKLTIKKYITKKTLHYKGEKHPEIYDLVDDENIDFWINAIHVNINAFWFIPFKYQNDLDILSIVIRKSEIEDLTLYEEPISKTWKDLEIFNLLLFNKSKIKIDEAFSSREFVKKIINEKNAKLFHNNEIRNLF